MSSSYLQGLNAYANSASEINDNFGRYREDVDNIQASNKGLIQAAKSRMDLDDLQGIGEEMAVRAFKKYGGKALGWVDKKAFGGQIGKDTDAFNDMVDKKFQDLKGRIGNKFKNVKERMGQRGGGEEEGNEGGEGVDTNEGGGESYEGGEGDNLMLEDGNEIEPDFQVLPNEEDERDMMGGEDQDAPEEVQPEEDLGDDAAPEKSFDDFMNQFTDVPRTETGDIDFERVDNQFGMRQADAESRRMNQSPEEKQDVGEETKEGDEEEDAGNEGEDDLGDDLGGDAGDAGETALTDLGGDAAETALTTTADTGLATGLEGAGTALDATGYGAIIGVPLQIAGAVLEGGAIYQAGKSIVDWFERDILGEKPKIKTNPIPAAPITLAEKGLMLTPSMDTLDTQPSYAGGW